MNLETDNVYHENYRFCQHTMTQIGQFQRNLILSIIINGGEVKIKDKDDARRKLVSKISKESFSFCFNWEI